MYQIYPRMIGDLSRWRALRVCAILLASVGCIFAQPVFAQKDEPIGLPGIGLPGIGLPGMRLPGARAEIIAARFESIQAAIDRAQRRSRMANRVLQ